MPNTRAKRTKESDAISKAMSDLDLTNAMVAHHMRVSDGLVSQWKTGRRPVPAYQAPRLATMLGLQDPSTISHAYGEVRTAQAGNTALAVAEPQADYDPGAMRRIDEAIDSLRYALGALSTIMAEHRPTEARDAARLIRKHVPPHLARSGLLSELLRVLDKAP
jgi:hypothetical protein